VDETPDEDEQIGRDGGGDREPVEPHCGRLYSSLFTTRGLDVGARPTSPKADPGCYDRATVKLAGSVPVRSSSVTCWAALAVAFAVGLSAGCYETTPHRVEVAARVSSTDCAAAVRGVFAGAGYVQLPSPPRTWMLFSPRQTGAYSSQARSGSGVGVTYAGSEADPDDCHVMLEALSSDANCAGTEQLSGVSTMCGGKLDRTWPAECLVGPEMTCELTSAPSPDSDAAVDDLARRLRAALGPRTRVN
jgi:hypothetical protein